MIEQLEITAKRWEYVTERSDRLLEFLISMTVNGVKYNTVLHISQDDFITTFGQVWAGTGKELLRAMEKNK
jgi:hypothetical protein